MKRPTSSKLENIKNKYLRWLFLLNLEPNLLHIKTACMSLGMLYKYKMNLFWYSINYFTFNWFEKESNSLNSTNALSNLVVILGVHWQSTYLLLITTWIRFLSPERAPLLFRFYWLYYSTYNYSKFSLQKGTFLVSNKYCKCL